MSNGIAENNGPIDEDSNAVQPVVPVSSFRLCYCYYLVWHGFGVSN